VSKPKTLTIEKALSGWMKASHYHCKDCGAELIYWGRLNWLLDGGVRAVGACSRCHLIMVEKENGPTSWILIK